MQRALERKEREKALILSRMTERMYRPRISTEEVSQSIVAVVPERHCYACTVTHALKKCTPV